MAARPLSTTLDSMARIAAYGRWLTVSVALRFALTYPWDNAACGSHGRASGGVALVDQSQAPRPDRAATLWRFYGECLRERGYPVNAR